MTYEFSDLRRIAAIASQMATDLTTVATREKNLVAQTLATVDKSKTSLVLQEMAKLPVDKLRDASDSGIRVETLKKYGITNMAAIYHASESQLRTINGISDDAAREIKTIATEMFHAIAASISYGMKADSLSTDDIELITSLHNLQSIRQSTRGRSA